MRACVLYPALTRDLLLTLAADGAHEPIWTDKMSYREPGSPPCLLRRVAGKVGRELLRSKRARLQGSVRAAGCRFVRR